jgi:hypothetical protein
MRNAMFLGLFILWLISIIRYVRRQVYRALHVVAHLYYGSPCGGSSLLSGMLGARCIGLSMCLIFIILSGTIGARFKGFSMWWLFSIIKSGIPGENA